MKSYFSTSYKQDVNGYVEILVQIIKMMNMNASNSEVNDFLFEVGVNLANQHSVKAADTLSALHVEINEILSKLGFGVCQIEDANNRVIIKHHDLPVIEDREFKDKWLQYFSVIMCGLYNCWFRQTGAPAELICRIKEIISPCDAVFEFKRA
ncbi:cellulose biosynthesis protein BcsD [uncultured Succinivibrio sp.]|uniref:cellulose biosynthesis protein BcsD n=1 Tax=uncultured Succinivibrio sp. TaxID=540749 RepID=UPI0025E5F2FB|nr:cellulose biosynthesis protein BcsD [uncultured Succinivibrio sp.]